MPGALERAYGAVCELCWELIELLFPAACFLCSAPAKDGVACAAHALGWKPEGARCARCSATLAPALCDGEICPTCRAHKPRYQRLVTLFDYRAFAAGREWVLAFKHGGRPDLARPLAQALAEQVWASGSWERGGILVPVPLHPWRRLERGYDQARLLATELALYLEGRLEPALVRARYTPAQGSPGSHSRHANVAAAFRSRQKVLPKEWTGKLWLVDDVVTSGATLDACALALRRAGAGRLRAMALARA